MRRVALVTMLTLLGGCAQDISPNSYSVGSVGMVPACKSLNQDPAAASGA